MFVSRKVIAIDAEGKVSEVLISAVADVCRQIDGFKWVISNFQDLLSKDSYCTKFTEVVDEMSRVRGLLGMPDEVSTIVDVIKQLGNLISFIDDKLTSALGALEFALKEEDYDFIDSESKRIKRGLTATKERLERMCSRK